MHNTYTDPPLPDTFIPSLLLTDGLFGSVEAKTAHGLLRCGERFSPLAVVDQKCAGLRTTDVIADLTRAVPIFATTEEALGEFPAIRTAVVGISTPGGRLTDSLRRTLLDCAERSLDLVSGLHDFLADDPAIAPAAAASGAVITDVRRTPPARDLRFWDGSVYSVRAKRISVLGTDCIVGKRTTARFLADELNRRGVRTEMIYTGQTGWMQGSRYGVIHDALVTDFTAGELEGAILACAAGVDPDIMLIEGQSSLRNPAGPCAEQLSPAAPCGVILQHMPARTHYDGLEHVEQCRIPSLESEIALIGLYGAPVLAVTLNLAGVPGSERHRVVSECRARCGEVPVFDVFGDGIGTLADVVVGQL